MSNLNYREGPHAWAIYAEQLFHHGYGYPLWMPDPDPSTASEVQIGDVGWVKQGGFMPLFNAMKAPGEPQVRGAVPAEYAPFNPPNLIISGPRESIIQPLLCSRTIKEVELSGGASAGGPLPVPVASGGGNFSFKCAADTGAFLLFAPAGMSREIESKRHVVNYMREHFVQWLALADAFGLGLREEEVWFVCGTTKTSRWAVAAFSGNYRRKEGAVAADLGSVAGLSLSVSISNEMIPQSYYRIGPRRRQGPMAVAAGEEVVQQQGGVQQEDADADQCIFIHYYKMKRRWGLKTFKASAGPHEIPPRGPDEMEVDPIASLGEDYIADDEFEQMPQREKTFDPVSDLLEYILQNSEEATMAIASDRDIFALFKDQEFPEDVTSALLQLRPTIEVDEHGVGTVSVHIDYSSKKRRLGEDEEDIESRKKPAAPTEGELGNAPAGDMAFPDIAQPHVATPAAAPPRRKDDDDDGKPVIKRIDPNAPTNSHDGSVSSLAYSADGAFAATGSEDTTVIVWDACANTVMYRLGGHTDNVTALAFSPDNQLLASGSSDMSILVRNVSNGQECAHVHPGVPVHALAFSPDGTLLLAGGHDGSLRVWDVHALYAPPRVFRWHPAVLAFIRFSPDERLVATGGTEGMCVIWDLESIRVDGGEGEPAPRSVLRGHKGMICDAEFAPDSRRIVTASDDGSARVWNALTGEALVILHEHTGPVWAVAFAPDGKAVASGSSDSTVKVCDSFSGERLHSLDGHDGMVNDVLFAPGGRFIVSASSDSTVRLWSVADASCLATFNEHGDNVTHVLFSPDGSTLLSGSHDGSVYIRSIVTE